jgi:hypothetical protein
MHLAWVNQSSRMNPPHPAPEMAFTAHQPPPGSNEDIVSDQPF